MRNEHRQVHPGEPRFCGTLIVYRVGFPGFFQFVYEHTVSSFAVAIVGRPELVERQRLRPLHRYLRSYVFIALDPVGAAKGFGPLASDS